MSHINMKYIFLLLVLYSLFGCHCSCNNVPDITKVETKTVAVIDNQQSKRNEYIADCTGYGYTKTTCENIWDGKQSAD